MIDAIIKAIFKSKMSLPRIKRYIDQLPYVGNIPNIDGNDKCLGEVKIAAVQREIKPIKKVEDYIDSVNDFIVDACEQRCQLVVFPEYNFFDLFGFIPGFRLLNNYLNKKGKCNMPKPDTWNTENTEQIRSTKHTEQTGHTGNTHNTWDTGNINNIWHMGNTGCTRNTGNTCNMGNTGHIGNTHNTRNMGNTEHISNTPDVSFFTLVFRAVATSTEKGLRCIFSLLAKKHGIYVYTGSFLVCRDKRLYNVGFLYAPDGRCMGNQPKIHLTDFEEQLGMARGDVLNVYQLDIGRIAFPVCMDATYFETFYTAAELGADLVVLPLANMEEYSLYRAIRGIWGRVQESYVYGIKASLNGWIAGMHFTGKAGVFAPLGLTDTKDGVLAISSCYHGNELVTCSVDYGRLRECRQQAEYYGDHNHYFEKHYVPKTYLGVSSNNLV